MADNSAINEIKTRVGIVDVVQAKVTLQRSGRNFKGLCPFHGEKSPSFVVFPESQSYHCFGCGANGDIFGFVMNTEGLEFRDALGKLARQAGVDIAPRDEGQAAEERKRERLYEACAAAALFYHNLLLRGTSEGANFARAYVQERGLNEATIATFQVGYAPDNWEMTATYLRERGFNTQELVDAGLIIEREAREGRDGGESAQAGYFDRFRNRLMFPIRDVRGRTCGFGARALDDRPPKYMNSPQTPIYDKSAILYGIDQATAAIKAEHTAVIVEGYMDTLIAHQTGHANVVAASGTALTDRQADLLKKNARRLVLALDADAAGDLAALRGAEVLEGSLDRMSVPILGPRGLIGVERRIDSQIRIMALPRGLDPDELLLQNPAEWDRLLAEALPVADHFIAVVTRTLDLTTAYGKSEAVRQIAPLIRAMGDPVGRAHYIQKVATLTQTPVAAVEQAVARATTGGPAAARGSHRKPADAAPPPAPTRELTPEEHLLALLLRYPEATLQPDTPTPARLTRSENRLILEAVTRFMLAQAPPVAGPVEVDRAGLRAALDPVLHQQYDDLLAEAERQPYIYPFALAAEVASRTRRLNEYNDRLWLQQYALTLADGQSEQEENPTDPASAAQAMEAIRAQLREQTTPARSTVYRDSRD
jgi:DNA primase